MSELQVALQRPEYLHVLLNPLRIIVSVTSSASIHSSSAATIGGMTRSRADRRSSRLTTVVAYTPPCSGGVSCWLSMIEAVYQLRNSRRAISGLAPAQIAV